MKPKTMMLMVVAIGCGLVASYMTSRLLAERSNQGPSQNTKPVLVAIKKVPQYTAIKEPEKWFAIKDVPEDSAPKKALASFDEIKGKKINKSINEEAYVYVDDLLDPKLDGMAASLSAGQRAVAIKVDPRALVGGFVLPGTRVDVVCTVRRGEGDSGSKIILQNMLVLAVDTKNNKEEGQSSILGQTVTLAAKPEEAQQLALAATVGELGLLLRPAGDAVMIATREAKVGQLGQQKFTNEPGSEDSLSVTAAPPIPAVLPPLPAKSETPVVEEPKQPEPEVKPLKTHTLTIVTGEYTSKHVFVHDDKEGWKSNVSRSSVDEATPTRSGDVPPPPALRPQPDDKQGQNPNNGKSPYKTPRTRPSN